MYLPIVASTFGLGMLIAVLPLYLAAEEASLRTTSLVLAAVGLGSSLGAIPAGALLARVDDRRLMVTALLVTGVATAALGATTVALLLILLRLSAGASSTVLRLSRQTYITQRVPVSVRGRAMSLVGGSYRIALLFGPLTGGVLVDSVGFRWTFLVAGALTAAGIVPAVTTRRELPPLTATPGATARTGLIAVVRSHAGLLARGGMVPFLAMTVREGRFVVLPLIGDELGLSATEVGALVAVGTGADVVLFPVAGWVMDRFGRLWAMIPAFTLVGIGLTLVGVADTTLAVVVGGAVIGVGNGLSAGTMLTLGSDLAPSEAPGPFLAAIAVVQGAGRVAGPLFVGVLGAALGLSAAAIGLAVACAVLIAWLVLVLGETSTEASA